MSLLKQNSGTTAGFAAMVLLLAGAGCATKGFVTKKVEPLDTRVAEVEGRTSEHAAELAKLNEKDGEIERDVSRVRETAQGAQGAADSASQRAGEAQHRADSGYDLAEKGHQRSDELEEGLGNVHNYRPVANESIQFAFDSSELNPDAKTQLESVLSAAREAKDYVIELKGFTDTTGSAKYNLALSERRAQAVVRHLTLEEKVPLYLIHVMGFGSESPIADNKSRDGRQQNRRVEVSVYKAGADMHNTAARTTSQTF